MSAPPGRPRRSNRLLAARYVPLVDVDPRAVPVLLSALEDAGVAAYVEPVAGSVGGYLEVRLPDRPTDRLWVDPASAETARTVVGQELRELGRLLDDVTPPRPVDPGPSARGLDASGSGASGAGSGISGTGAAGTGDSQPGASGTGVSGTGVSGTGVSGPGASQPDEDAAWRSIVAGWETGASTPVPPWPVDEDTDGPDAATPAAGPDPAAAPPPGPRIVRAGDLRRPDLDPVDPDPDPAAGPDPGSRSPADEGHYVPPPPPPVPRPSRRTLYALVGLALGLLVLFAPGLLMLRGDLARVVGVLAVLASAATLVLSLRDAPPADDGPDDGAVV